MSEGYTTWLYENELEVLIRHGIKDVDYRNLFKYDECNCFFVPKKVWDIVEIWYGALPQNQYIHEPDMLGAMAMTLAEFLDKMLKKEK